MPVRSLRSSILRWPDRSTVESAVQVWAGEQARLHPELIRLGYFGSYATGTWGVGSDLDLVAVVAFAARPFGERALDWDLTELPVPAEILVYTAPEWARVLQNQDRFACVMNNEVVWVIEGSG
jgi:uncharacterized protein